MKYLAMVLISLVLGGSLVACGGLGAGNGDFEKVLGITIEPSSPHPGDTVQVTVAWDSSLFYAAFEGGGPLFYYHISGGELIGTDYDTDDQGIMGPVEVRGEDLWIPSSTVQWWLPTDVPRAMIAVSLDSGGKKLIVPLTSD
jgi:hypothetical protein